MPEAQRRSGSRPIATGLAPAVRLATAGFTVDSAFNRSLSSGKYRIEDFSGRATFFANDSAPPVGSRFVQPVLARTIQLIADSGATVFYRGSIADSIAAEMQRSGGVFTQPALATYPPSWREPTPSHDPRDSLTV